MIPRIDKQYIQFGCAEWFWKQFLNSFVLQIEPKKYMLRDRADISFKEAQHIEDLKPAFFNKINKIVCSVAI